MKLLFFCTRWGQEHLPWNDFCKKVKDAGYDGVETSLPLNNAETAVILNELDKHGLKLVGQHWDTVTPYFDEHIKEYERQLISMAAAKPVFITSHTGKDFFSFEQNEQLLLLAQKISYETQIPVIHETHRGKFSFAAHITYAYLRKMPWLKLTLDISHWFAVAESYLADQAIAVNLALANTEHIHARIGYANGPQVSDPRSPEWHEVVNIHLSYWDRVIDIQKNRGATQFTFTPEFGPFPYMQHQPFSNKPLSNQWEINEYLLNTLKNRYKNNTRF